MKSFYIIFALVLLSPARSFNTASTTLNTSKIGPAQESHSLLSDKSYITEGQSLLIEISQVNKKVMQLKNQVQASKI